MPDVNRDVAGLAERVLAWARENGALADDLSVPPLPAGTNTRVFPMSVAIEDQQDVAKAEKALERVKVVAVAVDEERGRAVVLTRNQISASTKKILPDYLGGVPVEYIGHAGIEPNPPVLPQTAVDAAERFFAHNDRIACGSSLSAASVWGAGTLGALVTLADGTLCGLTNNHVTGACNHTRVGMHILSPAPFDADPDHRAPTAIGRHHSFVALASGDPRQVQLQELDVALFALTDPDLVTSMQGAGLYDTPREIADPFGGMAVKKVGRTTGLTYGEVIGRFTTPLGIPYVSDRFKSTVYFQNAWAIKATDGGPFSMGGDSGSLVVTGDSAFAVGLIFAGATDGSVSYMIPIRSVLRGLDASLLRDHNV